MSEIDRAELRRLLDEAETPWTIEQTAPNMDGPNWLIRRECKAGIIISAHEYGFHGRGEVIVAAVNSLPGLLDALDVAGSAIERVRALHVRRDEWCGHHKSTICEVACAYCYECKADWPCPTIQALEGVKGDE